MENMIIEGGAKTPHIVLDKSGVIELKGKSIPENSTEFYKPLFEWVEAYSESPAKLTRVLFSLEYFNTSSSKCILDVFRRMESLHKSGKSEVTIHWRYDEDDEDMLETGEDYSSMVNVPFVLEAVKS